MRTPSVLILAATLAATVAFAPATADVAADDAAGPPTASGEVVHGTADLPEGCVEDEGADARPFAVDVATGDGTEEARGAIALPDDEPTALVVFAHGYGHSSHSWVGHMAWAADELGAVALAMDYRGTLELPEEGEIGGTRGWQVREGAADSNAAALAVLAGCDSIEEVVLFGVSMGANTAGLALAAQPTRTDDSPLYDWWINVEGAANVVETYLAARSLAASGNAFANNAVQDIEREVGGPIEDDPQGYVDLAVVSNADAIAASGVKGVFHVHGVEDGLVPYDQSRELQAALLEASRGVAQEFWTALRRDPDGPDPDEPQTNATDYVLNAVDPSYESPFVGHGSEASADNDVMRFSLDRLQALLLDGDEIVGCSEGLYDATTRESGGTSLCG